MKHRWDLVVIGAGPAGLSAAATAGEYGLEVMVLDEQPSPGGQVYRNIERASPERIEILGKDYLQGRALVDQFRKGTAEYSGNSIVWKIEPEGHLFFSKNDCSREIRSRAVIVATGATERPVPFQGWTLPGVMGAGAVDANFKSSGTVPRGPAVLAGSGPLLLLTAVHLIHLGVHINGVLDTTPTASMLSAARYLPRALKRMDYLLKGLGMLAVLKKSGTTWIRSIQGYAAQGKDRLERVAYRTKNSSGSFDANVLITHEGVVPRFDFTRQLRIPHKWNPVQRYWYPETDPFGKTREDAIYVSGDGAFVHGGVSAALKGRLTVQDIAFRLGAISRRQKIEACRHIGKRLRMEHAVRPFMDEMYRPRPSLYALEDDVLVCRCEGVKVKDIRNALAEGCRDANEIKVLTRCGMGPCQSRMCGMALAEIVARHLDTDPGQIAPLTIRPPVRNLSLSELAEVRLFGQEA